MHAMPSPFRGDRASAPRVRVQIDRLIAGYERSGGEPRTQPLEVSLLKLLKDAPPSVRAEAADRLSGLRHAPPLVTRALACDPDLDIARPVLRRSLALCDRTLAEMAMCKSQAHLEAIAGRRNLTERVTRILVRRGDRLVLQALARNRSADLAPHCRRRLRALLETVRAPSRERTGSWRGAALHAGL
jgi:uncharacterized protein (DUF2336 family)